MAGEQDDTIFGKEDPRYKAPAGDPSWKTFDVSGNPTTNSSFFPATRVGWDTGPNGPVWTGPDFFGAQDAFAPFQQTVKTNAQGGNNFIDKNVGKAIQGVVLGGTGLGLASGAGLIGGAGGTALDMAGLGAGEAGMSAGGFDLGAGAAAGAPADIGYVGSGLMENGLPPPLVGGPDFSGIGALPGAGSGVQGGAGNTPLDQPAGEQPAGTPEGPSFIPAINNVQSLSNASLFGVPGGTAGDIALSGPSAPFATSLDGGGIATGGPGLGGGFGDYLGSGAPGASTVADDILEKIKKGGGNAMDWITKNPASAAMLGVSAANALSKPKLPAAAQTVQKVNTPNATTASGVVNSGGSTGPAWNTQKAAIDSAIDRQIAEKKQQILQQAQNSGMGVDSLVTIQQIQKMQEQMEGMRQQQYMQAQSQNVQAALSELGMSNQALGQVAQQQFATSKDAQTSASETAKLALMLQQMQKPTANQQAANG